MAKKYTGISINPKILDDARNKAAEIDRPLSYIIEKLLKAWIEGKVEL